jgi:hypothetical protein
VEIHAVPGRHGQITEEPHVRVLAEKLKACLDEAQPATAPAATSASSSKGMFIAISFQDAIGPLPSSFLHSFHIKRE